MEIKLNHKVSKMDDCLSITEITSFDTALSGLITLALKVE